VDYQWLSKGMRKVLDIHIVDFFTSMLKFNLVIIDDLESLTSKVQLTKDTYQLITMTAKDKPF
jgi:hypothetical protein